MVAVWEGQAPASASLDEVWHDAEEDRYAELHKA